MASRTLSAIERNTYTYSPPWSTSVASGEDRSYTGRRSLTRPIPRTWARSNISTHRPEKGRLPGTIMPFRMKTRMIVLQTTVDTDYNSYYLIEGILRYDFISSRQIEYIFQTACIHSLSWSKKRPRELTIIAFSINLFIHSLHLSIGTIRSPVCIRHGYRFKICRCKHVLSAISFCGPLALSSLESLQ